MEDSTDTEDLIRAWRSVALDAPPFVLPGDELLLENDGVWHWPISTLDEFVKSAALGNRSDGRFHLGLLPLPYLGDLRRATVFILNLNPGFAPVDYLAEEQLSASRQAFVANLRQEGLDPDYPFACLNPAFCWTGGFAYWEQRFNPFLQALASREGDYRAALSRLAQTACCLELVPYHSQSFGGSRLISQLASTQLMKRFVKENLQPRAMAGEVDVVITRQKYEWGLDPSEHIVVFEGVETRAAYLTQPKARALIERRLGVTLL